MNTERKEGTRMQEGRKGGRNEGRKEGKEIRMKGEGRQKLMKK